MLDRCSGRADLVRVVSRQIGADLFPVIAAIARAEQHLRSCIQRLRIVRRQSNRRDPVEPQHRLARSSGRRNDLSNSRLLIITSVTPEFLSVINPAAVGGIDLIVHAVANPDSDPISKPYAARPSVAGAFP